MSSTHGYDWGYAIGRWQALKDLGHWAGDRPVFSSSARNPQEERQETEDYNYGIRTGYFETYHSNKRPSMIKRILGLVSVLLFGLWASDAQADCRGVRRAIVQRQVAVVKTQTLLVAPVVPFTFGASYGAGVGYNPSYSPEYAAVLQKLARIEALLATGVVGARAPAQVSPPMQPAEGTQPAVFAKCAACHGPNAKPGLAFFDAQGQFVSDRCEIPGLMLSKMLLGEMPPPGKGTVTDEEIGALPEWIKGLKPMKK